MSNARTRRRGGAYAPVSYDPDRTPNQSGTFGIMRDLCNDTIRRLVHWGDARELHKDADVRMAAACALAIAEQVSKLLVDVERWPEKDPGPEVKRKSMDRILELRDDAGKLLHRFGANL